MKAIQFNAIVGVDQVISPPSGVVLPQGEIEVVVTPRPTGPVGPVTRPGPGLCKGMIIYMAPDFDAPLEDMREYLE